MAHKFKIKRSVLPDGILPFEKSIGEAHTLPWPPTVKAIKEMLDKFPNDAILEIGAVFDNGRIDHFPPTTAVQFTNNIVMFLCDDAAPETTEIKSAPEMVYHLKKKVG